MLYQILTIFPDMFRDFSQFGLVSRAASSGLLSIEAEHLRTFAVNTHGQVDDTPYGGGSGMVLRAEPAAAAIEAARAKDPLAQVVLFTPRGRVLDHELARRLAQQASERQGGFILLCCRYEGVDERIAEHWVDHEISLGDYVLMGGEVPAMAFIEATARFIPGVLGNPDSLAEESFDSGLLEYPQYTKPQDFRGYTVPEVLLSGHHAAIGRWRKERSRKDTRERRPDLLLRRGEILGEPKPRGSNLDVALIHYPVMDKQDRVITSSITNLDLHDIARSARTYGIGCYYVVHPTKVMRKLMQKICEHWSVGYGAQYNPNRTEALDVLRIVPEFDDVLADIEHRSGRLPKIVATSAKPGAGTALSYGALRQMLGSADEHYLLLFGTGWGLAPALLERADYRLEPIYGPSDYNHLSVRAAAAIMFDRLFGRPTAEYP